MARGSRIVTIDFTPRAMADLQTIWLWNAEKYNPSHADQYVEFLRTESESVLVSGISGHPIPNAPELRFLTIRKRNRGHGHVVVFEFVNPSLVRVLRLFHTAEDWPPKVRMPDNGE
jgi:plasmid stabilization system protein ParE